VYHDSGERANFIHSLEMANKSKSVAVGDNITRETTIHLHKHILKR
jgi:hypothetical protein